jgi:hypothetical protein
MSPLLTRTLLSHFTEKETEAWFSNCAAQNSLGAVESLRAGFCPYFQSSLPSPSSVLELNFYPEEKLYVLNSLNPPGKLWETARLGQTGAWLPQALRKTAGPMGPCGRAGREPSFPKKPGKAVFPTSSRAKLSLTFPLASWLSGGSVIS